jgi:hypothetical protein
MKKLKFAQSRGDVWFHNNRDYSQDYRRDPALHRTARNAVRRSVAQGDKSLCKNVYPLLTGS